MSPELHAPTDRLDVRLQLLASEGQPLKHWSPVHVHLGSAHVMGRVALLEGDRLAPGDTALAQLVLEEKIGALAGDRVILRDPSATRTIAGAAVIDPFGPPRNRRSAAPAGRARAPWREADAEVLPKLLRLESGFVETRPLRPVAQSPAGRRRPASCRRPAAPSWKASASSPRRWRRRARTSSTR